MFFFNLDKILTIGLVVVMVTAIRRVLRHREVFMMPRIGVYFFFKKVSFKDALVC